MSEDKFFSLTYRFSFPDGREKKFEIKMHRETCELMPSKRERYPEWTRLGYRQCRDCPLNNEEHPRCPIAVNIVDIVEFFKDSLSTEQAVVSVETHQRITTSRKSSLFPAISSLIGIFMVTSGCPVMDKLRPMARFHLPFADTEETIYRALSMYALGQYFRQREGLEPDWHFEGLKEIYQQANRLNIDFVKRLNNDSISEATTNAITSLDCFAQEIDFSISEEMLVHIQALFKGAAQ